MRRGLVSILIFVFVMNVGTSRLSSGSVVPEQARANPALLLAPEAAVAMLEALILACAGAYAIGMITEAQNQEYQDQLTARRDQIQEAVRKGLRVSADVILKTVALALYIQQAASLPNICDHLSAYVRTGRDRRQTPRETTDRRARVVANCSSFEQCCGDFRRKLGSLADFRNSALRVYKNAKKSKLLCCFEYDATHGGLEIFDENGRHMGERGCDDENPDPCAWTPSRGSHARPSPGDHTPSSNKCAH